MKERNFGIDLLRIISMIGIVVLHLLKESRMLEFSSLNTSRWGISWILEIIAFTSVNVFAMISGFVNVNRKQTYSRLLNIWFQVVFYLIIFFIISKCFNTAHGVDIIDVFFPITRNYYWYVTAYVGMFILLPILNAGINALKRREVEILLVIITIFICLFPCIIHTDPYKLNAGYSSLWLFICYIWGGGGISND